MANIEALPTVVQHGKLILPPICSNGLASRDHKDETSLFKEVVDGRGSDGLLDRVL